MHPIRFPGNVLQPYSVILSSNELFRVLLYDSLSIDYSSLRSAGSRRARLDNRAHPFYTC